ncbi:MAG: hypothetical protein JO060_11050 [Candidatus Eremiobacteraeota bacterium]|nr:hypothetical protein [Candidatus Eremiobacteraeota bacterium]
MHEPPASEPSGALETRAGLWLPITILIRPQTAFQLIAATGQWLPAYLVIVALGLAELYLTAPTVEHLVHLSLPAGAAASRAEFHGMVARDFGFEAIWTLAGPFVLWGFVGALLWVCAVAARVETTSFRTYFALCMNCAVPSEIGQFFDAAATRLHDPSAFRSTNDVWTVIPASLAALRPHGSTAEIAFLSYWSVFAVWSLLLLGYGYAALAKMSLVPALLLVFGIGLVLALAQVVSTS